MEKVINQFQIKGHRIYCERYGFGHINTTYLLVTSAGRRYILQKINKHVFENIPALMENISSVTAFLRERISDSREAMSLIPTISGDTFLLDDEFNYWRMYDFVEDSICLQKAEMDTDFYQSGVAFGKFLQLMADFPSERLHETIKDFHNTIDRYKKFYKVLKEDPLTRASKVEKEIAFALSYEKEGGILHQMRLIGELPVRVTHNDTKLNNVMLDKYTRKALCVIDLDTVMPGLSVYDYGDSIRFGAAAAPEDEKDLSKVQMSLKLFRLYTRGFIEACPDLTKRELEMLPMGAKIMTLECGLRFLTDYINGDKYFNIHYPEHNLDRCRTQFKMVTDMESKWDEMSDIVRMEAIR